MRNISRLLFVLILVSKIGAQVIENPIPLDSIVNPSLELSSSEGGWEKVGNSGSTSMGSSSSPVPYDGAKLLRISDTAGYMRQALHTIYKGHRYRVTAWVYNHGTLGVNDLGIDTPYEVKTNHGASWKQISVEFVSTGAPAIFYAKYGPGTGKTYFDVFEAADVSTKQDSVQNAPANHLKYPSQVIDLNCWKITLPIDSALEIFNPTLLDYTIDPWFKVVQDKDGWAVQFRANHGGSTTSGSNNPRSELREMLRNYRYQNSKSEASWSNTNGTHTMWIKQKVTHLTYVKPHTVTGQIHNSSDDVAVFRVEGLSGGASGTGGTVGVGDSLAKIWITDGNNTHAYLVDSLYRLGTVYQVKFIAHNGVLEFEYDGKKLPYKKTKNFTGCFFKIGDYTQSNSSTAPNEVDSAYAEVYVYDYAITHDTLASSIGQYIESVPDRFILEQNYPNPFNPETVIRYSLPQSERVSIKIYNSLGSEVGTLFEGFKNARTYEEKFNADKFASGVYFYKLQAGNYSIVRKMMLLK
jgi:hypothetical protein